MGGDDFVGGTATATFGTWTGTGPISEFFQWQLDGVNVGEREAVGEYVIQPEDFGKVLGFRPVGINSAGPTIGLASNTVAVQDVPVCTVDPVISGDTPIGSTLTTNGGTFTGGSVVKTYKWYRAGVEIALATAATYDTVALDAGLAITNKTFGTNDAGGPISSGFSNEIVVDAP